MKPIEKRYNHALLFVMLLSFYEHLTMGKIAYNPRQGIQVMASRSFARHDGAVAILNPRKARCPAYRIQD